MKATFDYAPPLTRDQEVEMRIHLADESTSTWLTRAQLVALTMTELDLGPKGSDIGWLSGCEEKMLSRGYDK